MDSKPRPDHGPGSNGLRGGIKTYSLKTTTGQWLEGYGGPSEYKRGFTTKDFQTEAQHAQLGAFKKDSDYYGAGLPHPNAIVGAKLTTTELFNPAGGVQPKDWKTNSQIMHMSMLSTKVDKTDMLPIKNNTREQIEEYRKNWTSDSEIGRSMRYRTESRTAGNDALEKFRVKSIRFMPGTPKPLETFRENLVQKFGVFAFCALRTYLGGNDGVITCDQLRSALNKTGIPLKQFEFNQILAYITPKSSEVSLEMFLRTLKGSVEGFDSREINSIFNKISGGEEQVSLESLKFYIRSEEYPEFVDGIEQFAGIYSFARNSSLTVNDFIDLHNDMYVANSAAFSQIIQNVWNC